MQVIAAPARVLGYQRLSIDAVGFRIVERPVGSQVLFGNCGAGPAGAPKGACRVNCMKAWKGGGKASRHGSLPATQYAQQPVGRVPCSAAREQRSSVPHTRWFSRPLLSRMWARMSAWLRATRHRRTWRDGGRGNSRPARRAGVDVARLSEAVPAAAALRTRPLGSPLPSPCCKLFGGTGCASE